MGLSRQQTTGLTKSSAKLLNRFVVPEDFGAVGDGVTDDQAAIQAAIDATPATGGTVRLGADRVYGIGSSVVINKHGMIFEGSSMGNYPNSPATIVCGLQALSGFSGDAMIEIGTTGGSSRHNTVLRNFQLHGDRVTVGGSFDGIRNYRGNNAFTMENIVINQVPGYGFYAPETEVSPNDGQLVHGYFRNIKCRGCGTGARFYKCNAIDVHGWAISGSDHIGLEIIRGNGQSWSGLSVESNGEQGIYIDALSGADRVQGITLVGPRLESNNEDGTPREAIYIGSRARGISIISPYLFNEDVGISIAGQGVAITAAHFNTIDTYGVEVLSGADDVVLNEYDIDAIGSGAAYGGAGSAGALVVTHSGNIEQVASISPGDNSLLTLSATTTSRSGRVRIFGKEASLTDATATTVLSISHTANGAWGFEALILVSDRASGSTNSSAKVMKVAFAIVRDSAGSVARSAVTEVFESASATVSAGDSDIGTVTVTLNAVDANTTEVQVSADGTGTAARSLRASGEITEAYVLSTQATIT